MAKIDPFASYPSMQNIIYVCGNACYLQMSFSNSRYHFSRLAI